MAIKWILVFWAVIFLIACRDCQDCTIRLKDGATETTTVCKEDFSSRQEYKDYTKTIEADGGQCR